MKCGRSPFHGFNGYVNSFFVDRSKKNQQIFHKIDRWIQNNLQPFSILGGNPKNLKVFEEADENAKKRTTLYRSVCTYIP